MAVVTLLAGLSILYICIFLAREQDSSTTTTRWTHNPFPEERLVYCAYTYKSMSVYLGLMSAHVIHMGTSGALAFFLFSAGAKRPLAIAAASTLFPLVAIALTLTRRRQVANATMKALDNAEYRPGKGVTISLRVLAILTLLAAILTGGLALMLFGALRPPGFLQLPAKLGGESLPSNQLAPAASRRPLMSLPTPASSQPTATPTNGAPRLADMVMPPTSTPMATATAAFMQADVVQLAPTRGVVIGAATAPPRPPPPDPIVKILAAVSSVAGLIGFLALLAVPTPVEILGGPRSSTTSSFANRIESGNAGGNGGGTPGAPVFLSSKPPMSPPARTPPPDIPAYPRQPSDYYPRQQQPLSPPPPPSFEPLRGGYSSSGSYGGPESPRAGAPPATSRFASVPRRRSGPDRTQGPPPLPPPPPPLPTYDGFDDDDDDAGSYFDSPNPLPRGTPGGGGGVTARGTFATGDLYSDPLGAADAAYYSIMSGPSAPSVSTEFSFRQVDRSGAAAGSQGLRGAAAIRQQQQLQQSRSGGNGGGTRAVRGDARGVGAGGTRARMDRVDAPRGMARTMYLGSDDEDEE
ncbi:hypothetical protein BC828DRAFT_388291 [Blastocladiella britannica]|nr:hypothetical protein BC828DRAFT_388291 [Blastocladiella britannica]